MDKVDDLTRRAALFSAVAVTAAIPALNAGEARAAETVSAQERLAIKLVNDLVAAAQTGDPRKVVALVSDDIVFKGAANTPEINGKAALLTELNKFLELPVANKLTFARKINHAHAMGGATGTAVIAWREDGITIKGKREIIPIAAIAWIVGDKVKAWYDIPLVEDPGGTNWGFETVSTEKKP